MDELPGAEIEHRGQRYRLREAPLSEAPAGAPRPMVTRVPEQSRNYFAWTGEEPALRQPLPEHAVVWHLWRWEAGPAMNAMHESSGAAADGAVESANALGRWRYVDNFMTKRALCGWVDAQV